ncbi:hypothetical protein DNTS_001741 [Danionella cerebrum]|uniref:RIIa domain-containing protein n=1 Tax=Danionella cerebrum TaxID=2873325 RepID=A0A553MRU5_9TELE|nr:hypothetical protein DNTS_001741 [Danionella translucida]
MAEKQVLGSGGGSREADREFLTQTGLNALLSGALLPLLGARPADPLGFLAEHFTHLAEERKAEAERRSASRGVWLLSLAHHSRRSAFDNNIRQSFELLSSGAQNSAGVGGRLFTETLQTLCSEGGLSGRTAAPLIRRLKCYDHECVSFPLFRQAALTCAVFAEYIRTAQCLYAAVASVPDRPAELSLCCAALETLRVALDTPDAPDTVRLLAASAKIAPASVAQAMVEAKSRQDGKSMDAQEFEDEAAKLFIERVQVVT